MIFCKHSGGVSPGKRLHVPRRRQRQCISQGQRHSRRTRGSGQPKRCDFRLGNGRGQNEAADAVLQ